MSVSGRPVAALGRLPAHLLFSPAGRRWLHVARAAWWSAIKWTWHRNRKSRLSLPNTSFLQKNNNNKKKPKRKTGFHPSTTNCRIWVTLSFFLEINHHVWRKRWCSCQLICVRSSLVTVSSWLYSPYWIPRKWTQNHAIFGRAWNFFF